MSVKKLVSCVTFIVLFPVGLAAQTASPAGGPAAPMTYGGSATTPLQFAGAATPTNVVTITTGVSTLYDDNVLSGNSGRASDEALSFDARLGVARKTEHVTISFDYMPFYTLYRQFNYLDRVNHAATLGMNFQLSSRFMLGLRDTFSYQNGIYPTIAGQPILAGPASPTALNSSIYSPTARTLMNTPGLSLTFMKSSRTSLTLSGSYSQRKFGGEAGVGQPLYNDTSVSGSLQYQYRVTEHTSFGFFLLHGDSTYQGGQIFGNRQRSQTESGYFSVSTRLSPTVTVTFFGGPQYFHTLGQSSVGGGLSGGFEGSGGGSITDEVRKTALVLSFQRAISDGGGLYTSVINTSASFGVRRRLVGRWEASWSGSADQSDTSILHLGTGEIESVTGMFTLSRPMRGGSTFRIGYDTIHQLTKGSLPATAGLDRNEVTIGFDYQLKAIPVGR
jgi:hypothetical protein